MSILERAIGDRYEAMIKAKHQTEHAIRAIQDKIDRVEEKKQLYLQKLKDIEIELAEIEKSPYFVRDGE